MEHQGGQDRGSKEQVLKVQETSLLLGGHQQSVKEPPNGGDFKKHYNQLSIKDKGRDQQVFQCTGIVMEVSWQIAIVRWIVWRLSFRTTIACKLPSKYLTDLPDDMNHCPIMTSIHVSVCLSGLMIKICRYIKEHGWCSNIFSEVTRMRQLQLMLAEAKCAA